MRHAEVLELKKRFKKDKASFNRIAGCYVNEQKEKLHTFNHAFLTMSDEEIFKYLEITNKLLSGKIKNNLLNVEFPVNEEKPGGKQALLYDIMKTGGKDIDKLDELYDLIIDSYQSLNHYVILLFFDDYDVPVKTEDNIKLDDSEEVYSYFLCGICPIEATKQSLGYFAGNEKEGSKFDITKRDMVVNLPEAGFLFPSFNDRSADIHEALVYTKNAKDPHKEVITDVLGCETLLTCAEQKIMFDEIIKVHLDGMSDDEIKNAIIDSEYTLSQLVELKKAEDGDLATLKFDEDVIISMLEDVAITEDKKEDLKEALAEAFNEMELDSSILITNSNIKIGEVRAEKKELSRALRLKEEELEKIKVNKKKNLNEYETQTINGTEYVLIPVSELT